MLCILHHENIGRNSYFMLSSTTINNTLFVLVNPYNVFMVDFTQQNVLIFQVTALLRAGSTHYFQHNTFALRSTSINL